MRYKSEMDDWMTVAKELTSSNNSCIIAHL